VLVRPERGSCGAGGKTTEYLSTRLTHWMTTSRSHQLREVNLDAFVAEQMRSNPDLVNTSGTLPLSRMLLAQLDANMRDDTATPSHATTLAATLAASHPWSPLESGKQHDGSSTGGGTLPRVSSIGSIATQYGGNGYPSPTMSVGDAPPIPEMHGHVPSTYKVRMQSDLVRAVAAAAAEAPGTAGASLPARLGFGRTVTGFFPDPLSRIGAASSADDTCHVGEKRRTPPSQSPALLPTSAFIEFASAPLPIPTVTVPVASSESAASSPSNHVLHTQSQGRSLPRIANLSQGCADGLLLLSATACLIARDGAAPCNDVGGSAFTVTPSAKQARLSA